MNRIDSILNRVTMYRLVVYYLAALIAIAAVLCFFGILPYSPAAIAFSTGLFLLACMLADLIFSKLWKREPGRDSSIITALILALIATPVLPTDIMGAGLILLVSAIAIASKYVVAWERKQVFNPAALSVAIAGLAFGQAATWWVGSPWLMLPVIIGGYLIVRKIERLDLFLAFAAATLVVVVATSLADSFTAIWNTLAQSSLFFLGFVMLTEPSTMPPSRGLRLLYGALVGILFAPAVHLFSYYFTPETALLAGNIFSFIVSPKGKHTLTLKDRVKLADGAYEFIFVPDRLLPFRAGQYLEWTLSGKGSDARGNRRYFTIASAPEEAEIRLGVRFYEPMSTFKRKLMALKKGETISASQLAGDFTLPKAETKKVAFIAGGIGVTPFRSMVGEMITTGKNRDAVLLYGSPSEREIAYRYFFDEARKRLGMKVVYAVENGPESADVRRGRIDEAMLAREIPDYADRIFYVSGPRGMVTSFVEALRSLGLPSSQIKTDYFPGFA